MTDRPTSYLSPGAQFLTRNGKESPATLMHAADLLTIVATGNGQDVVDAIEAMTILHGQFLTALMMRTVLDRLDAEKLMQLSDWDFACEPMQWTPPPAEPEPVDAAATLAAAAPTANPNKAAHARPTTT